MAHRGIGLAAQFAGPVPGCDANSPTSKLPFNGTANNYGRLPRVLHLADLPSPADQRTWLVVD